MMKRILHALAALWPGRPKGEDRRREIEDRSWETEERRREHEGPWLPEARNGLLYHLNAMMRMGETVRELATRECTHLPSHESTKEQPNESANLQISSTNQQIDESTPKKTDNHLPKRIIVSEREQPAERIGEPLPIAQVLARLYLRDAPRCAMGESDEKVVPAQQAGSTSSDSAKPNSQPLSLAPRRTVPLASWVLALFMCLLSAQQVSAQAEPAAAAVMGIPEGGVVLGDTLPDWFWDVRLSVVNHPQGRGEIWMGDYKDQLLVLDFWASYCTPCVASMDKWNSLHKDFNAELSVIGIHLYDFGHKAEPFAKKKNWDIPISVGNRADTLVNRLFYANRSFGQVWIKDGKLFAIPKNSIVSNGLLERIFADRPYTIEMNDRLTYFDKRYTLAEGEEKEPGNQRR